MPWYDPVKQNGIEPYFVFRGQAGARQVAWGTRAVAHPDGLVQNRMWLPSEIVRGVPEAYGAPPERVSTTIVLDNTDGALTWLLTGGDTPQEEFTKDSVLSLTGKIYLGIPAGGTFEERPITPTLTMAGSPAQEGRMITISLGSQDEWLLGSSRDVVTPRVLRSAEFRATGRIYGRTGSTIFGSDDWDAVKGQIASNLDSPIPFAYGPSPIPLVALSGKGTFGDVVFAAFVSVQEPDIAGWRDWPTFGATSADRAGDPIGWAYDGAKLFKAGIKVPFDPPRDDRDVEEGGIGWVPIPPARFTDLWLVGMVIDYRRIRDRNAFLDSVNHIVPLPDAEIGLPAGRPASIPNTIRQLITDHSPLGEAAVHLPSFEAAAQADSQTGLVGGHYLGDTNVWEVVQHLCSLGYGLFVGTDDKIHILPDEEWSWVTSETAKQDLPHIRLGDIGRKQWREVVPAGGAGARGGAVARVTVDWSATQRSVWAESMLRGRFVPARRPPMAGEPEARVSGAWIFPPSVRAALETAGAGRTWPRRRWRVVIADLSAAGFELGELVRVSHPDGAQDGGYVHRLGRVERIEIMPGDMSVALQLEDLGSVEHLRVGVLDSIEHWIRYRPAEDLPVSITIDAAGQRATTSKPVFTTDMIGCSIRTWGAERESLRRSWRITGYISPTEVAIGGYKAASPAEVETIAGDDFPTFLAAWFIHDNRTRRVEGFRPFAICLASEESGQFTDGKPGFVLT